MTRRDIGARSLGYVIIMGSDTGALSSPMG